MRLFAKIFLIGTIVFSLVFLIFGYFFINFTFKNNLDREKDFAIKQYQYDKFAVQAALIDNNDSIIDVGHKGNNLEIIVSGLADDIDAPVAFFAEDGALLYTEIDDIKPAIIERLSYDAYYYQISCDDNEGFIIIGSQMLQDGVTLFFVTQTDISEVMDQQIKLIHYFLRIYCIALGVGMLLILFSSTFLTRPLKRMAKMANQIACGDYSERLIISGKDEMSEVAGSFNQMAEAVEEKVKELSQTARQKEDFVANFAHELKTPLTAVIGYADMLYQKELPHEEVKRAAEYIWNEGMRLESLSFKLMDLTVLNSHEFPLQEVMAKELLKDITDGIKPLLQDRKVAIHLNAESAYIRVDYDLLKTLILNIIDNSIKAGCSNIELSGIKDNSIYHISIKDDGQGIPEGELSRITEAFYMVDKSRSRKQHGAGLGLTLAMRIAQIHGSRLEFESKEGYGTEVSFSLSCEEVSN